MPNLPSKCFGSSCPAWAVKNEVNLLIWKRIMKLDSTEIVCFEERQKQRSEMTTRMNLPGREWPPKIVKLRQQTSTQKKEKTQSEKPSLLFAYILRSVGFFSENFKCRLYFHFLALLFLFHLLLFLLLLLHLLLLLPLLQTILFHPQNAIFCLIWRANATSSEQKKSLQIICMCHFSRLNSSDLVPVLQLIYFCFSFHSFLSFPSNPVS